MKEEANDAMPSTIRLTLVTLLGCGVIYPLVVLTLAQILARDRAQGSLITREDGRVLGSRLIAQDFRRDTYLQPRPSAASYDAAAAAGSNLAASNPDLRTRAQAAVARLEATSAGPIPSELVTASGSGLDPHVTLRGAEVQAARIAQARHVSEARVLEVLRRAANAPTVVRPALVNVLEANLALDRELGPVPPGS